jgi:hypothetical protein
MAPKRARPDRSSSAYLTLRSQGGQRRALVRRAHQLVLNPCRQAGEPATGTQSLSPGWAKARPAGFADPANLHNPNALQAVQLTLQIATLQAHGRRITDRSLVPGAPAGRRPPPTHPSADDATQYGCASRRRGATAGSSIQVANMCRPSRQHQWVKAWREAVDHFRHGPPVEARAALPCRYALTTGRPYPSSRDG